MLGILLLFLLLILLFGSLGMLVVKMFLAGLALALGLALVSGVSWYGSRSGL